MASICRCQEFHLLKSKGMKTPPILRLPLHLGENLTSDQARAAHKIFAYVLQEIRSISLREMIPDAGEILTAFLNEREIPNPGFDFEQGWKGIDTLEQWADAVIETAEFVQPVQWRVSFLRFVERKMSERIASLFARGSFSEKWLNARVQHWEKNNHSDEEDLASISSLAIEVLRMYRDSILDPNMVN